MYSAIWLTTSWFVGELCSKCWRKSDLVCNFCSNIQTVVGFLSLQTAEFVVSDTMSKVLKALTLPVSCSCCLPVGLRPIFWWNEVACFVFVRCRVSHVSHAVEPRCLHCVLFCLHLITADSTLCVCVCVCVCECVCACVCVFVGSCKARTESGVFRLC